MFSIYLEDRISVDHNPKKYPEINNKDIPRSTLAGLEFGPPLILVPTYPGPSSPYNLYLFPCAFLAVPLLFSPSGIEYSTNFNIENNDLHLLTRYPTQLRAYLLWTTSTKATFGSIINFISLNRVYWPLPPTFANPVPFADPRDYKILRNDWPYGLASGIEHLVVWLKNRIPVDEERDGDMTDEGRRFVEGFVNRVFVDGLKDSGVDKPEEKVLWFKNWAKLQSVRSLEHVHVLVRDVPQGMVERWIESTA